jgi:Flp pilus assembly protein protease CpaA
LKHLFILLFFIPLCICSIYDIKKRIIPNYLVAIILLTGIINSIMYHSHSHLILGALFPSFPLLILRFKSKYPGFGDIKLLSAVGTWLGWTLNFYVFILACILSLAFVFIYKLITNKQLKSVAFAPFILMAVVSLYFFY